MRPRIPRCAGDEPQVSRICVCPTLGQCAWAIEWDTLTWKTISVYAIDTDKACRCYGVFDQEITDEHWLTKPSEFKLVAKIKCQDAPDFHTGKLSKLTPEIQEQLILLNDYLIAKILHSKKISENFS